MPDKADFTGIFSHNYLWRWSEKEKISNKQWFSRQKRIADARAQRKIARLVQADKKAIVAQITTCYN